MNQRASKSAAERRSGKHQIDEQRARILDAAEALFLQSGLENTSMMDIARRAGITRVTLYRYFANRDEIAVDIQVRMLEKINSFMPGEDGSTRLDRYRNRVRAMLRNYSNLKEAFRFIGMFDKIYLDQASDSALSQWTKAQLMAGSFGERAARSEAPGQKEHGEELGIILSTVVWFLEKLALRGELTWSDPAIPLEEHLKFFEKIILSSFDLLEEQNVNDPTPGPYPLTRSAGARGGE